MSHIANWLVVCLYERIEALRSSIIIPECIHLEIINHQGEVALLLKDQERFYATLRQDVAGTQATNGELEAMDIYGVTRVVGPHEMRVGKMAELFVE
jgi:hypothetical protein